MDFHSPWGSSFVNSSFFFIRVSYLNFIAAMVDLHEMIIAVSCNIIAAII